VWTALAAPVQQAERQSMDLEQARLWPGQVLQWRVARRLEEELIPMPQRREAHRQRQEER
jgi:hypothetical protein